MWRAAWGKVLGGMAGFAAGGLPGAVAGVAIGHGLDWLRGRESKVLDALAPEAPLPEATRRIAFTLGTVVLGTKMPRAADRPAVDKDTFARLFRLRREGLEEIERVIERARRDGLGPMPYARQLARMLSGHPTVLHALLNDLFLIAVEDGGIDPAALDYLTMIAEVFGISGPALAALAASHGVADPDPYRVLGVPRGAGPAEVKAAHRRLVRAHHPDRRQAKGLPPAAIAAANERMAAINAAYDRLRRP